KALQNARSIGCCADSRAFSEATLEGFYHGAHRGHGELVCFTVESALRARTSLHRGAAAWSTGASAVSRSGDSPRPLCASQRSASRAAMQPVPAAVIAWR